MAAPPQTAHATDSGAVPRGRVTSNTPSRSHRYSYVATALLPISRQHVESNVTGVARGRLPRRTRQRAQDAADDRNDRSAVRSANPSERGLSFTRSDERRFTQSGESRGARHIRPERAPDIRPPLAARRSMRESEHQDRARHRAAASSPMSRRRSANRCRRSFSCAGGRAPSGHGYSSSGIPASDGCERCFPRRGAASRCPRANARR